MRALPWLSLLLPSVPQKLSRLTADSVSCPLQVVMEVGSLLLQLWQLILSYLSLLDLGHCTLVCRAWYKLVLSLGKMHWQQLCLGCLGHQHHRHSPGESPSNSTTLPPKPGPETYRIWTPPTASSFQRRRGWRQLCVGTGDEFGSLRAALATASPYDHLVLLPGVHEEQREVLLKVAVEVVGRASWGTWCYW